MMSSDKASPRLPATPPKKAFPNYLQQHLEGSSPYSDYYMTRSSQGGTPSSVASTVDGDSAPVTPAINQFSRESRYFDIGIGNAMDESHDSIQQE